MSIHLQQVINSRFAIRFLSLIARGIPPSIGYRLCDFIGNWIAQRDSKLTQAVRTNQWIVRGANLNEAELDKAVRETLQNNARDLFTLYHYLHKPEAMQQMIRLSSPAQQVFKRPEFSNCGLIILGLHLSNFDLVLRCSSQQGFKAMILTLPDPQGGRRVEYEMRKQKGMNIVPASVNGLRRAIKHLEKGGMVVTGLDRPIPHPKQHPKFFGRPASLPTEYVYLASKARVPVMVMVAIQQSDGKYHVLSSEPIEITHDSNHPEETLRNAETVLKQAENFIRLAPQQWNVPLPVWSDSLVDTQT